MIDKTVMKVLEENLRDKNNYLARLDELDILYDAELVNTLFAITRLQKESLEMAMKLLSDRYEYLNTITYKIEIIIEKYIGDNREITYYVYPSITPNIQDGEKYTFSKAGLWFVDEKMALSYAELLKENYKCDIKKILI